MVSNARAATCTATYCDSDIATTTTLHLPNVNNETSYVLYLAPSVNTMSITWYGTSARNPVFTLTQTSPTPTTRQPLVMKGTGTSFQQTGLEASTTYCYSLVTDYTTGGGSSSTSACAATLSLASQTPSDLNVFSKGQDSLFLNWKDNSTSTDASRYFEFQRIQVTPATPTLPDVRQNSKQGVDVNFTVKTGNTPFYSILKSFATTTAGLTPSTSTWDSPSSPWVTVFSGTSTDYLTPSSPTNRQITLTDKGPFSSNLYYYYAVQNCSFISVDWLRTTGHSGPDTVCTDPVLAGSIKGSSAGAYGYHGNVLIAASDAIHSVFSSIGNAFGRLAATITGTAEAQSGGGPAVINDYFDHAGTSMKLTAAPSYTDTGLAPGTVYAYRVELCYPSSGGNPSCTGWSDYAGARTATPDMTTSESSGLCVDNNICVATTSVQTGWGSTGQCSKNSDCANIGRSSKIFQEQ